MDDAVRARAAAREALADVEPARLGDVLDTRLADAAMTPATLTLRSAQAIDPGVSLESVAERAAGVQLIYEGLRLTRRLAHEQPWLADDTDDIPADLEIVAADVLVSRGFYILARTEAAGRAVETVRSFGRDQTVRARPGVDTAALDRNLEADVFALAVVAGATAVGGETPPRLIEYATTLARKHDDDLPSTTALPDSLTERIATLAATGSEDRVPSSATDS